MVMTGRKSHSRALSVWANGVRMGVWQIPNRGPMEFEYDAAWAVSDIGRPLSLSLPIPLDNAPLKGERVLNYFDNLLPDSEAIRQRIGRRFRTETLDTFDLLQAIGRDCVGAVQLLGIDEEPAGVQQIDGTPLSEREIETLLTQTGGNFGFGAQDDEDDFRISLAGAQEKTALLWHDGQWMKPHGATPTTHILKLPLGSGRKPARGSDYVSGERMALHASAARLWFAGGGDEHRDVRQATRAEREAFRSPDAFERQVAFAFAARRFLPGDGAAVAQEI